MEKNKNNKNSNNNSSTSLVFGRWPQTKMAASRIGVDDTLEKL